MLWIPVEMPLPQGSSASSFATISLPDSRLATFSGDGKTASCVKTVKPFDRMP